MITKKRGRLILSVFVALVLALPLGLAIQASAAGPQKGGVFTMPLSGNTKMWPMQGGLYNILVNKVLYSSLIRYDREDLHPTGDLAESFSVSEDGLVWTFKLKKNVKWHDGTPFTAADVKWTFDTYTNPDVAYFRKRALKDLAKTEMTDDYTIKMHTKKPNASFPVILGYLVNILPKHKLEHLKPKEFVNPTEFLRHPIGTGSFKFDEYVPGSHLKVVANKDYYDGAPNIDAVVYKIIRDIDAQIAQAQTGQLDMVLIEPHQVPAVEKNPNLRIDLAKQVNYSYIGLRNTNPLFNDKRVRQALNYAVDKEAILKNVYKGMGTICNGPISPILSWVYYPDVKQYRHDPEKAKALLKEAGWSPGAGNILHKDGNPFKFTLLVDKGNPVREQLAVVAQDYWKRIGLDVQVETGEFAKILKTVRDPNPTYDAFVMWYIHPPDPDLIEYYGCGAGIMNMYQYCNSEADKLMEQGRSVFDRAKRAEIYKKFQEIIAEDAPNVYLYFPSEIRAMNKRVKNYASVGYRDASIYLNQIWLEK